MLYDKCVIKVWISNINNGCLKCCFKAELNLFKYRLVPKMKLTLPIVQNICTIGQLKIGREQVSEQFSEQFSPSACSPYKRIGFNALFHSLVVWTYLS